MPEPYAVRAESLVKEYRGGVRALDGLDLEVRAGEVLGYLGPNGAGKSTTLRILLDLLRPTSGSVRVLGAHPRAGGAPLRARIGYLPGELAPPTGRRTAGAFLSHLCDLRGGRGRDQVGPLAERFGLDLARPVRTLSKGNKQKVGIVQAFMHDPDLLVLDEPTSGLDPLLQQELVACVRAARERGASVLMSSHVISEVEESADRVAIVRAGRVVDVDAVHALRHRAGQRVVMTLSDDPGPAPFDRVPGVEDVRVEPGDGGTRVSLLLHGEPDALLRAATEHHVRAYAAQDRELEELFLDHYRTPARQEQSDVR